MSNHLLTSSRLKVARKCKREHRNKYLLGYRPVIDAEELLFGLLVHVGLEAWWLAVARNQIPLALRFAIDAMRATKSDPFDLVRAETMLAGYDTRWADEAKRYEVLGVEVQFETDIRNPKTNAVSRIWRLGGKLDVLVRDRRDGRVRFMEHKTSSEDISPGTAYWRRLRMDAQVSVYFDGAASLGYDVAGCIYDVLGKPQQRPIQVPLTDAEGEKIVHDSKGERMKTLRGEWRQTGDTAKGYVLQTRDETLDEYRLRVADAMGAEPDAFFSRLEVVRLDAELDDARADVWALAKELRDGELEQRHPRNPDACERHRRYCSFFDVCTGAASLDDPTRFYVVADVHPELAGATSSNSEQSPKEVGAS